jgi:outer membrane protein OmpA-like peptidoglycan-associated protein
MASKKYSFVAGVLCLLASYGFSQTTLTVVPRYDVTDSSVVSARNMAQYTEFMNGTYNFPAKPRSMMELGLKVGSFNVRGDVPSLLSPGFGVHLRKALGHVVSLRLEYMYGIGKGLNWKPSGNYYNNTAWTSTGYNPRTETVYYNYRNRTQDLSLEALFALNNINFYKAQTNVSLYGLVGIGAMIYDTKINALNGTAKYNFGGLPVANRDNKDEIKDRLKDMLDDEYETQAEVDNGRKVLFDQTMRFVGHFGAGIAFRLSPKINIALEDRFSVPKDDLMDGQRWAEQVGGTPVLTPDYDSYNFASLGLNINLGKGVEPLWWVNPLEYAYQELRRPRLMILPKPTLPDSDGDGVTDQFDLEPATPKGCPVDTHGVSLDTDGDGVPDCRDKEKITPTYCQPVDADGVGKCPCPSPDCFPAAPVSDCATALGSLPSIMFAGTTETVSNDARSMLASVAARLRNNPNCRLTVVGYCVSPKAVQTRGVARVDAVVSYLVEKEGISRDRITTMYGQAGGDCGTVDLRGE